MKIYKTKKLNEGVTLLELLVVVLIITILMGVGVISLFQINIGRGLDGGASALEGIVREARTAAVARQTNTRIVINNDITDENYRREIITLVDENEDPDGVPDWQPLGRSVFLPSRVFVDLEQNVDTDVGELGTNSPGFGRRDPINPSGAITPIANEYLEFNFLGVCKIPNAAETGAELVLVVGRLVNDEIQSDSNQKLGLVVWRNGSTTLVDDISLISSDE